MNVSINNTLSRQKDVLTPQTDTFRMYCCGPTVYGPAHIGNFRTFVVQDTLRRVLECSGMKVMHVRNITDVDDKTIRESRKLSMSLKDFTKKWEDKFHSDCDRLNMLRPSVEPRATEHIAEQLDMVSKLVENGTPTFPKTAVSILKYPLSTTTANSRDSTANIWRHSR